MIKNTKQKLTLDRPVLYQVKVPGKLDENWPDWAGEMAVTVVSDKKGLPVPTLIGILDQAALLGLLRRLYSLGFPLLSAVCIEAE